MEGRAPDRITLFQKFLNRTDTESDNLLQFSGKHRNSKTEHALVVTTTGKVFRLDRNSYIVDFTVLGDMLHGAKVIHNHTDYEYSYGDYF